MKLSPKKLLLIIAGLAFVCFLGWHVWQLFGPNPPIVVSKDTTYITAPLRPNGLPDYEKYLLEKMREGVTPENNAAVLFWQAIGPGELTEEWFGMVAKEIGLNKIPSENEVLQALDGEENRKRVVAWLQKVGVVPRNEEEAFEPIGDPPWTDANRLADELIDQAMDRPWTNGQIPPLAEWVTANETPLDLLVAASNRSEFYSPSAELLNDSHDMLLDILVPELTSAREAGKALSARAMWRLGEGQPAEAWVDIMALYRLSRLLGEGNLLVDQMVSIEIERLGKNATFVLLDSTDLPLEIARSIRSDLFAIPYRSAIGRTLYEEQRLSALESILYLKYAENLDTDEAAKQMLFYAKSTSNDWNECLRHINDWYNGFAPLVEERSWKDRNATLDKHHDRLDQLVRESRDSSRGIPSGFSRKVRARLFSDFFVIFFIPAASATLSAEDRANTQLTLTQLAAAIAVYRAEHGEYPEKLEALVPDILDKLPGDLFHDNPFAYRRTDNGYLLYSCGPNGKDDGGSNAQMHVYKGYLADEESAAQLHELFGDDLPMVEDDTAIPNPDNPVMRPFGADDSLDAHIPQDADDIAIRVPLPKLELPKRVEPKE